MEGAGAPKRNGAVADDGAPKDGAATDDTGVDVLDTAGAEPLDGVADALDGVDGAGVGALDVPVGADIEGVGVDKKARRSGRTSLPEELLGAGEVSWEDVAGEGAVAFPGADGAAHAEDEGAAADASGELDGEDAVMNCGGVAANAGGGTTVEPAAPKNT